MKGFVFCVLAFGLTACASEDDNSDSGVDCPAIALPCPDGTISCDPEEFPEDCVETVVGEGVCAQTLYCMLGD